jgi:hypothetical protein
MKRFHVHAHVTDLAASIAFYSRLFAAEPTRVEADYAKWMLDDPCINFAISTRGGTPGIRLELGEHAEEAGIVGPDGRQSLGVTRARTSREQLRSLRRAFGDGLQRFLNLGGFKGGFTAQHRAHGAQRAAEALEHVLTLGDRVGLRIGCGEADRDQSTGDDETTHGGFLTSGGRRSRRTRFKAKPPEGAGGVRWRLLNHAAHTSPFPHPGRVSSGF